MEYRDWPLSIIDLTHPLESSTQVYPGDPKFRSEPAATIGKDGCGVLHLHMGTHTGTHIDAPYHFISDGKRINEVDLTTFMGRTVLVDIDCQPRQEINPEDFLSQLDQPGVAQHHKIIFFRTGWSKYWKTDLYLDHPYLSQIAAYELIARGFKIIGIDTLSPDSTPRNGIQGDYDFAVHKTILGSGGFIVENLTNLEKIPQKYFISSILPLHIKDGDGSPVRAVAWQEGNVFGE